MSRQRAHPPGSLRRFVVAAAAFVVTVAGFPAVLTACSIATLGGPNPLPGIGSTDEITAYLDRGLTSTEVVPVAVRLLLIVGWLLWLGLVTSMLGAVVEARTGAHRRWLPFGPFAGLSRWIAAGLTTFSVVSSGFVSAGAPASRLPFVVSAAPVVAASAAAPAERVVPAGFARVQPGESAETFAERLLGDPARWTEVWDLNRDQAVGPAGETWDLPWKLGTGWDLRLPTDGPDGGPVRPAAASVVGPMTPDPPPDPDERESADRVVVQAGDSYWEIAEESLGDDADAADVARYTDELVEDNAALLGYSDPAMIRPGDVVVLVDPPASADESAGAHEYVVEPGDSYWKIAEQRAVEVHGADGAYATVVYQLMLDLVDLNAPRLGHDDRQLLEPGDVVWLYDPSLSTPGGTVDLEAVAAVIAETVDHAESVVDAVAAQASVAAASEPAPEPEPPLGTTPATTEPVTSAPALEGGSAGGDQAPGRSPAPLPIGVGEAALLATGIVALLAARRRARLRAAEPPARVPLRTPAAVATERALRQVSDADRLLRVDIGIRAAAALLATGTSQITAVRVAPDGTIELLLSSPAPVAEPWVARSERWVLPASVALDDLAAAARTVGMPCVALAPLGVDEHGWEVLVDLEAVGLLSIDTDADDSAADDVIRALAAGLASSLFAEVADLIGVAVDETAFLDHRHAQSVDSADEAVELAATLVGPAGSTGASAFAVRARRTGGESWEPVVILVGASRAAEVTPALVGAAAGSRRVALAVAGPVAGDGWVLRRGETTWVLEPVGIRLRPVGLARDTAVELSDVAAVEPLAAVDFAPPFSHPSAGLGDAVGTGPDAMADASSVGPPCSPGDDPTAGGAVDVASPAVRLDVLSEPERAAAEQGRSEPAGGPGSPVVPFHPAPATRVNGNGHAVTSDGGQPAPSATTAEWSLMVRLIGPVELTDRAGVVARFERSKSLELLAWLVTHRDRSTRAGGRTALWELDVRDATFANVVSEARRAMARHVEPPADDEWLRRTLTDELSLHQGVVADVDVIRSCLAAARGRSPGDALDVLRPAVELVRGLPFAGTAYLWPDAEGVTSSLVLLATSLTAEYARLALGAGDVDGVFWATGQGLTVIAGQEALIGLRMQAHASVGDRSGVRVEWEAYERVLNADPWSDGEPSPKLVALRRQLLAT